uniref:Testis derived transcript (3 LIM domains) n=1 Tax=Lates calcarifer TaxID=8187 RepID=A0A4W6BW84_LATCA
MIFTYITCSHVLCFQMTLGHEFGAGAACLKCKDKCEGFELHFWRKICRNCKCGLAEHDVAMNSEENKKVGKLFEDTKYTGLIAKLKTDGLPSYRGNMITISLPVTYEWAPPVANKYLAVRYIELLPPEKRPVAGTEGAAYRRQQMARQLPEHDQDPSKCHELSPAEVKQMEQFVRKYKDEALGVGDVLLPEEMALVQAGGQGGAGGVGAGRCTWCWRGRQPMRLGEPAVYAERAGYDKLWHPACFVCCTCNELLVDMIYFWKKGKLYCGRHYGDSEKPRCGGCDELIFSNEYTQAEGQNWHLKHFCCFDCDCILAGETYVMENEKPVCKPCYMKNYAVKCSACQNAVEPEAQRVSYGEHHWHAEPECFKCSGCSKCLMGQRFMAVQGFLFCSVECKKKTMA